MPEVEGLLCLWLEDRVIITNVVFFSYSGASCRLVLIGGMEEKAMRVEEEEEKSLQMELDHSEV